MTKHEEEKELDQFWRDLSAEMISDTITLEEADRRMAAAEDDELSEAQIQNIVQRATTRRSSLKPAVESLPRAPRGRIYRFGGFRLTANVAATGAFTALLLSAGLVAVLWEGSKKWDELRFDHATMITVDATQEIDRRGVAIARVYAEIFVVIKALKEASAGGGELGRVADEVILGLLLALDDPADLELRAATMEELRGPSRSVQDSSVPIAARCELVRELGRQSVLGISSIAHSSGLPQRQAEFAAVQLKRLRELLVVR